MSAVLLVTAFALQTARADVVFTRTTQTAEAWAHYTATFTAPYSGNYTLGFNLTAGGPSGDNAILIDAVRVAQGATTLFADGFETPDLSTNVASSASGGTATIGNWVCRNYSGVLDGSPPNWGLAAQGLGSADGTSQYGYLQAVFGTLGKIEAVNTLALVAGQTYTVSFYQATRRDFGGVTSYTVSLDYVVPSVYASGLSPVIAWDPIFAAGPIIPDSAESKPVPTVGYGDPRWTNPHAATAFAKNSHPWEHESWVPAAFKFDAKWINAWPNLSSNGHGFSSSSSGWSGYPYFGKPHQSWTKYSTTVVGSGSYVLQFLADNASWIYIDGALVGFQDYNWSSNGTGRYTIQLNGAGAHELSFVIWDGGGAAGGKFRLETTQSFLANNPGATLPPAPATVTLANLSHTYDGTAKSASVATAPAGLTTVVTYDGSSTPPTAVGTYNVVAKVTAPNYLGSATGTLTIGKATAIVTLANLAHTYDGTVKSATATTSPAGLSVVFNYAGGRISAGSYGVQALVNNPNYTGSVTGSLEIAKADATVTVNGYTGTYDGAPHGATGSATGVGGADLSASLNLGAAFTNAPGGTATWTFAGGTNYNDATGTAAIVINKANAIISVNGYTGTYDGAAHRATGSATGVGGTDLSAGLNLGATFTNAPGGTATWTFAGGTNYNDATGTAAIVIHKANATISVNGYTGTYDGAAHGATGSVTGIGGTDLSAGLNLGASFTNAPGGAATWTFAGGINYNDATGTAAIVINKANATVTVNGYTGTYDGGAHGATGSATGVGGTDLSASLNLGTKFTNAPGGTATWTFAGGTNYNDATGTAAIVIGKANATVVVTPYNVEYDGLPHFASVASITGTNGESGATVGTVTLNTTHTSVGVYSDSWSFTGSTNYNHIAGTPITNVIKDTTAPALTSVTPSNATLWPPNHQMVPITVTAAATDLVGVTSLKIINVTSNEPDNGLGDGDTAGDIQITGNLTVNLRAERGGAGAGRIYTITVEARDAAGNASTKTCTVSVPKNQRK